MVRVPVGLLVVVYASALAGSPLTGTNWAPVGVPGLNDRCVINHAMVQDADWDFGESLAAGASVALTIGPGGSLTRNANVALTIRGDVVQDNGWFLALAGDVVDLNDNLAVGNQEYSWQFISGNNQPNSGFELRGAVGNRVTLKASGTQAYFHTAGFLRAGFQAREWRAENLDRASNGRGIDWWAFDTNFVDQDIVLEDGVADANCGRFGQQGTYQVNSTVIYRRFSHLGTGTNIRINGSAAVGTGTKLIEDCMFTGPCDLNVTNLSVTGPTKGTTFKAGYTTGGNVLFAACSDVVMMGNVTLFQDWTRGMCLFDGVAPANPHLANMNDQRAAAGTFTEVAFEVIDENSGDLGDCILLTNGFADVRVVKCLFLPDKNGVASATWMSALGDAGVFVPQFENCAGFMRTGFGAIVWGEAFNSPAGMFGTIKGNIFKGVGGGGGKAVNNINGAPIADVTDGNNITHNAVVDAGATPWDSPFTNAPNATGGITDNPQWVRESKLKDIDADLGGPGTFANILLEWAKLNGPTEDARYYPNNLRSLLYADYRPTAAAYNPAVNPDHNGLTIGPVAWQAPAASGGVTKYGAPHAFPAGYRAALRNHGRSRRLGAA